MAIVFHIRYSCCVSIQKVWSVKDDKEKGEA